MRPIVALCLLLGCGQTPSSTESSSRPARTSEPIQDSETLAILKAERETVYKCIDTEGPWAAEHDRGKTIEAMRKLAAQLAERCEDAAKTLGLVTAKHPCAKEIQKKFRAYATARAKFYRDIDAWLDKHKAIFGPAMKDASLWNACDKSHLQALCEKRPSAWLVDEAQVAYINAIKCVERELNCEPPSPNVCAMPKVLTRLSQGAHVGDRAFK